MQDRVAHPSVLSKLSSEPDWSGMEVLADAERESLAAESEMRLLQEVEQCTNGEPGSLLRREGLYSSHLS